MSRKYPKKVRKEFARKLAAAEAFVETWTNTGLASSLITDYTCTLTCEEAKTYSALMRSFGYVNTASSIIADHCEDCDVPSEHFDTDVWTVDVGAMTFDPKLKQEVADLGWTLVLNAEHPREAEAKAEDAVRAHLHANGLTLKPGVFINVSEIKPGEPGSLALYDWIDMREAA
ncbi:hypothetical protein [Streptomyces werraensis]|uniref:hypothetical protein n=1 Tax=Streptomyces werraensis TaxID=68284 RepID=UPI0036F770E9